MAKNDGLVQEFSYRALSQSGQTQEGKLEARTIEEATSILRSSGQTPISINPITEKASMEINIGGPKKVKTPEIAMFCNQLSTMVDAGIPLDRAVDVLSQQTSHTTLKESLASMSTQIKQGISLSRAMRLQPKIYPNLLITMVEAGEVTGNLDETLRRMAIHYTKENAINNKVRGAMIYPMILAVLGIVLVIFMLTVIFPTMTSMLAESNVELPFITKALIGISNFLIDNAILLIIGTIVAVILIRRYLATKNGKRKWHRFILWLPLTKGPIAAIVTSRFTRTLASLTSSGIPIVKSLESATETANNMVVSDGMERVIIDVQAGRQLAPELEAVGVFPPMMLTMVAIGEETGALDTLLEKTADYYEEQLDSAIANLIALIEPIMILLMAAIIGVIIIAIMIPMFDLTTNPPL